MRKPTYFAVQDHAPGKLLIGANTAAETLTCVKPCFPASSSESAVIMPSSKMTKASILLGRSNYRWLKEDLRTIQRSQASTYRRHRATAEDWIGPSFWMSLAEPKTGVGRWPLVKAMHSCGPSDKWDYCRMSCPTFANRAIHPRV